MDQVTSTVHVKTSSLSTASSTSSLPDIIDQNYTIGVDSDEFVTSSRPSPFNRNQRIYHRNNDVQSTKPIDAVAPTFGDSHTVLKRLYQEATSFGHLPVDIVVDNMHGNSRMRTTTKMTTPQPESADDAQLQSMIEKYQSHVLQQQQQQQHYQQQQQQQQQVHHHQPIQQQASSSTSSHVVLSGGSRACPISLSQPNLNNVVSSRSDARCYTTRPMDTNRNEQNTTFDMASSNIYHHQHDELYDPTQARVTTRMMNLLSDENKSLRLQLEAYVKKTIKLQQLELGYQRIQREYEDLVRHKEKQEVLENAAVTKMDHEIARLRNENVMLHERVENLTEHIQQLQQMDDAGDQLNKLNMIINEIIPQNKELLACKERQTVELRAQQSTLEEQRTHIQILEKALRNAQEKVARKESECGQLSRAAERAAELQQALQEAIEDKQRRDEAHKREMSQLEMELTQAKMQLSKESVSMMTVNGGIKKSNSGINRSSIDVDETVSRMRRSLDSKDERILSLERGLAELEAKYHSVVQTSKTTVNTKDTSEDESSNAVSATMSKLEEEKDNVEKLAAGLRDENAQLRKENLRLLTLETKVQQLEERLKGKETIYDVEQRLMLKNRDSMLNYLSGKHRTTFDNERFSSPSELGRMRLENARQQLLATSRRSSSVWSDSSPPQQHHHHHHSKLPASFDYATLTNLSSSITSTSRNRMSAEPTTPTTTDHQSMMMSPLLLTGHTRTASANDYLLMQRRYSTNVDDSMMMNRGGADHSTTSSSSSGRKSSENGAVPIAPPPPPLDEQIWNV